MSDRLKLALQHALGNGIPTGLILWALTGSTEAGILVGAFIALLIGVHQYDGQGN